MAQKNFLKELLKVDQEPFQLRDYIADRKCQLEKQSSLRESRPNIAARAQQQQIQLLENPKKPISSGSIQSFRTNFCKNACFFSSNFHESPDFRKSPLFEFPSPLQANGYKSPYRGGSKSNPLFLHVPAKTATLLLEAAMRIQQKQSNPSSTKSSKTHLKSSGFRLFGSVIKRLTHRRRGSSISTSNGADREELGNDDDDDNEIVRWAAGSTNLSRDDIDEEEQNGNKSLELRSCSTSTGTRTDTNTSCSSSSGSGSSSSISCCRFEVEEGGGNYEFVNVLEMENDSNYDIGLCPVSPFRFALYKSPSPDHHQQQHHCTRRSPANSSPTRHKFQDNVSCEKSVKFQGEEEEDEEDKEQNSPVSILDPPFEDDDQGLDDDDDEEEEEEDEDLDHGYAFVQRTKQQLLHKLHRFEKLAELDPLELEHKLAEEEDLDQEEALGNINERDMHRFVREVITETCFGDIQKPGMKRLLSDIITYEEQVSDEHCCDDPEETSALVKRVCRRLDSWKQVESNTIDMMAEMDLRREGDVWKNHSEQIDETAWEIGLHIFAALVDELTGELVC